MLQVWTKRNFYFKRRDVYFPSNLPMWPMCKLTDWSGQVANWRIGLANVQIDGLAWPMCNSTDWPGQCANWRIGLANVQIDGLAWSMCKLTDWPGQCANWLIGLANVQIDGLAWPMSNLMDWPGQCANWRIGLANVQIDGLAGWAENTYINIYCRQLRKYEIVLSSKCTQKAFRAQPVTIKYSTTYIWLKALFRIILFVFICVMLMHPINAYRIVNEYCFSDQNECSLGTHKCEGRNVSTCVNLHGSYRCGCSAGYYYLRGQIECVEASKQFSVPLSGCSFFTITPFAKYRV